MSELCVDTYIHAHMHTYMQTGLDEARQRAGESSKCASELVAYRQRLIHADTDTTYHTHHTNLTETCINLSIPTTIFLWKLVLIYHLVNRPRSSQVESGRDFP
jgi:hypothetical protein